MNRDLRKGRFSIQIEHQFGTDTIGAEAASLELVDGVLAFKARLKPIDGNQRADIDRCKDEDFQNVKSFWFHDAYIYKGISSFVKAYSQRINSCSVEVEYGLKYRFDCDVESFKPDGVRFNILPIV